MITDLHYLFFIQVDHLFAGADADMDDLLKFDEILKNHELFVGSEATDYGAHLENLSKFEDELQFICQFCHFLTLIKSAAITPSHPHNSQSH